MKVHIVIPARYNSSRLPGKPLLDINGYPMIWHVYQRAKESGFESIVVATDDQRIVSEVQSFGGEAIMTDINHESGTDRLAEVARVLKFADEDIVINLQGDEPLVPSQCIALLANAFEKTNDVDIATLSCRIKDVNDVFNPNVVKVVANDERQALYFSRAPIPWNRGSFDNNEKCLESDESHERHIGMYAYKVSQLKRLSELPVSSLEKLESLEQLRAMQAGMNIYVEKLNDTPPHGVDTFEDYQNIIAIMESSNAT